MLGWLLCKFGVHDTVNGSLPGIHRCARCGKFM